MTFLTLFWEFFKTGLFAVGGGLATLPFLRDIAVRFDWFTLDQLSDMIAVSEATPGPIGVNMATYAGFNAAYILGALTATLALVLPSFIILCVIARFLKRYNESRLVRGIFYALRPATAAIVTAAVTGITAALSVHHFGELFLRDSVTLTDGCNRGVAFGDAATLAVTNGLTFTILRPVTWNGVVRKVGGGTLSLGNDSLRFGGADQLENPEFGKNVLSVEAGALQVTSASAADGLSIRMAEGTRLIVNADADADHALRLVRAGSALTTDAASGHFDVEFDVPDEPRGFTSVICVSSASNLEFRCKKPWKGYGCEVERRTVNGETTYLAKVELVGFVLVFR